MLLSASGWAQGPGTDFSKIEITAEKIAPNVYMLSGSAGLDPGHQDAAGRRIGVLAGAGTSTDRFVATVYSELKAGK